MRTGISALISLCLIGTASHAQSLKPEPGVWRSESTVLVNGTDLFAQMRQAQQAMLDSLPAEQRAAMQAMLGEMGDLNTNDYCISAEEASQGSDAWAEQLKKDMPNCDISVSSANDNSLSFSGNCRDTGEEGFVGDISGEMQLISRREIHSRFTGEGLINAGEDSDLPISTSGKSTIETRDISRWIGSDCSQLPEPDDD